MTTTFTLHRTTKHYNRRPTAGLTESRAPALSDGSFTATHSHFTEALNASMGSDGDYWPAAGLAEQVAPTIRWQRVPLKR